MNGSNSAKSDSRGHCTAKANPPRWSSGVLLRRPEFPPREIAITESSTSEVSASLESSESQRDTKNCPASTSYSPSIERKHHLGPEAPIRSEPATYRTESVESSRKPFANNMNRSRPVSWEERCPCKPLGWVGKRALSYQVTLALHSAPSARTAQLDDP